MSLLRVLAAWLVTGVLLCVGCDRIENVETTYSSFDDVIKANAIGEGKWIPQFLPQSARDIREKHNLDTNEIWLTFEFGSNDLGMMLNLCKETSLREVIRPRKSPGSWWPEMLVHSSTSENLGRFNYYRCTDGGEMAIDFKKNQAFYWERAVASLPPVR